MAYPQLNRESPGGPLAFHLGSDPSNLPTVLGCYNPCEDWLDSAVVTHCMNMELSESILRQFCLKNNDVEPQASSGASSTGAASAGARVRDGCLWGH